MMNNGFNYPAGGYYGGYTLQPAQQFKMTSGLRPEEEKMLKKNNGFSLEIGKEELYPAFCAHRYSDRFATSSDDEGNFTCAICGTKYQPFTGTTAEARELINQCINLLETTKQQSIELPTQTIQDVFQIIPLLKRIPELYSRSIEGYKRAMGYNETNYIYGTEGNAFNYYQTMLNPMAGAGYYDPAMMQQQQVFGATQQPMYPQQPGFNGQMQQPMYQAQQPVYPQQPGFNAQMQQPMYPQQPGFNQQAPQQGNPFNMGNVPVQQQPQPTVDQTQQQAKVTKTLSD